jgi:transmembrane sensor
MEINKKTPLSFDDFNYKAPSSKSTEEAWDILENRLIESEYSSKNYFIKTALSIAASIVLVVTVYFFSENAGNKNQLVTHATVKSEIKEIALPDGSVAILNAVSSIAFNLKNWEQNKVVLLDGEAYFKVKKGNRFSVETNLGKVEVLGTVFDVYCRNDNFNVSCTEGAVKVSANNKNIILKPGDFAKKTATSELAKIKKINAFACWTENKFCFEEESLHNILDELSRRFNLTIDYSNTENKVFSGSFNANSIEEALQFICEPLELQYLKQNNIIYIKTKNHVKSN